MTEELRAFLELATLPSVTAVCALGALLMIKIMLSPPEARPLGWVGELTGRLWAGVLLAVLVLAVVFGVGLGFGVSWAEIAAG